MKRLQTCHHVVVVIDRKSEIVVAFAVHLLMPLQSLILDNGRLLRRNCCKRYRCRHGSIVDGRSDRREEVCSM